MNVDLSAEEIATIIESLKYSHRAKSDAQGTPDDVRRQNLERIDLILSKLRASHQQGAA
jgi:hypothetical protein